MIKRMSKNSFPVSLIISDIKHSQAELITDTDMSRFQLLTRSNYGADMSMASQQLFYREMLQTYEFVQNLSIGVCYILQLNELID